MGHSEEFIRLSEEVAQLAGVTAIAMEPSEALQRAMVEVPHGVFIDGSDTLVEEGREFARRMLARVDRILIATGRRTRELDPELVAHRNTRVVLKPFTLSAFEAGLRWVNGEDIDDDKWYEAESGPGPQLLE